MSRYVSLFTGKDIDEILNSVKTKLDSSSIANDFDGGTNRIASAEIAKDLYFEVTNFKDPNYLKNLFLNIPGIAIFTTAEKAKLDTLSTKIVGSFTDYQDRDETVITTTYKGGEISFVKDDGNGYNEIALWDIATNTWKKMKLYDFGEVTPATVDVASTVTVTSFDYTEFVTAKVMITAIQGSSVQTQEVIITATSTSEYMVTYAEVGNANNLYTLSTNRVGNIINIIATTANANTVIRAKRVAEY